MTSQMLMLTADADKFLGALDALFVADGDGTNEDVAFVGDEIGEAVVDHEELKLSAEAMLVEVVVQAGGRMPVSGLKSVYEECHWMKAAIGNLQCFLKSSILLESVSGKGLGKHFIQLVGYEVSSWLTLSMDEPKPHGRKKFPSVGNIWGSELKLVQE